jgi:hypothetical protein
MVELLKKGRGIERGEELPRDYQTEEKFRRLI